MPAPSRPGWCARHPTGWWPVKFIVSNTTFLVFIQNSSFSIQNSSSLLTGVHSSSAGSSSAYAIRRCAGASSKVSNCISALPPTPLHCAPIFNSGKSEAAGRPPAVITNVDWPSAVGQNEAGAPSPSRPFPGELVGLPRYRYSGPPDSALSDVIVSSGTAVGEPPLPSTTSDRCTHRSDSTASAGGAADVAPPTNPNATYLLRGICIHNLGPESGGNCGFCYVYIFPGVGTRPMAAPVSTPKGCSCSHPLARPTRAQT